DRPFCGACAPDRRRDLDPDALTPCSAGHLPTNGEDRRLVQSLAVPKPDSSTSAVVVSGGKQYRVAPGDRILVDRLAAEPGATEEAEEAKREPRKRGRAKAAPKKKTATVKAEVAKEEPVVEEEQKEPEKKTTRRRAKKEAE